MINFFIIVILLFVGCSNNQPQNNKIKNKIITPSHTIKHNYISKKYQNKNNNIIPIQEVNTTHNNKNDNTKKIKNQLENNNNTSDNNITKVFYKIAKTEPLKNLSKIYTIKKLPLLYINLGPIVHFDTNKYTIKRKFFPKLNNIINKLKEFNCSILIVGHTDSKGTDRYNQALSEMRAREVYKYLIKRKIREDKLDYIGYGEEQPLTTNATSKGRAINRRVELLISKKLNLSYTFLQTREINTSYWNNHNIKTAGKIEISKKGWTKKLQPSKIKNILIKLKKKKRTIFNINKTKRTLKIKLKKRTLNIKN